MKMPSVTPLLLLSALSFCQAERDPNAPWGAKPPRKFRMFWKDASNVLEDLAKFDYLFIKFHGCVWSEYGIDNFDDDGEYRDGDENWYQGRTTSFRANAAYSLYGTLRGKSNFGWRCQKKTYINTFFTFMGADTILDSLGTSSGGDNDYGHDYCFEADDVDDDSAASTTMGCSLTNPDQFVMALFSDDYCEGQNFLNTTSSSMKSYNRAMQNVNCDKVWDYSRNYNGRKLEDASSSYGSAAEQLLMTSIACDLDLYEGRCPDPYGIKRRYQNAVTGNVLRVRLGNALRKPLRIMSTIALLVGLLLGGIAYYVKNPKKVRRVLKRTARDLGKSTGLISEGASSTDVENPTSPERSRTRSKDKKKKRRRKKRSPEEKQPVNDF